MEQFYWKLQLLCWTARSFFSWAFKKRLPPLSSIAFIYARNCWNSSETQSLVHLFFLLSLGTYALAIPTRHAFYFYMLALYSLLYSKTDRKSSKVAEVFTFISPFSIFILDLFHKHSGAESKKLGSWNQSDLSKWNQNTIQFYKGKLQWRRHHRIF